MDEFDLPGELPPPLPPLPSYEDLKIQQMRNDEEYARNLSREESGSDSDSDALKVQGSLLGDFNNERDTNRDRERANLKRESEQLKRERDQMKIESDTMRRSYDSANRERNNANTQLYREKYDNEKERRLRDFGLNLIPHQSIIGRNFLENKIEQLVKRELKRGDDQKSESELSELIKSLIKKSTTSRKPISKKKSSKKKEPNKKSSKKKAPKKKSSKKKAPKKKSSKKK
jgi:hypothetical protein